MLLLHILLTFYTQLHRTGSRVRFLDLAVRAVEAARARRHHIHCAAEATIDISTLVSSHHRINLLMVLVHRIHIVRSLVHRHELLCTFRDVFVLCVARDALQAAALHLDGDNIVTIVPNDCRLRHQSVGARLSESCPPLAVPHFAAQHSIVDCHVLQLLRTVRSFLLHHLLVAERTQGQEGIARQRAQQQPKRQ